jgi:hypothetical protein
MTGTYQFARQGGKIVATCNDTGAEGFGDTQEAAQKDCEDKKMGLTKPKPMEELAALVIPKDCGPESGKKLGEADRAELEKIRDKPFLPEAFKKELNAFLLAPSKPEPIKQADNLKIADTHGVEVKHADPKGPPGSVGGELPKG